MYIYIYEVSKNINGVMLDCQCSVTAPNIILVYYLNIYFILLYLYIVYLSNLFSRPNKSIEN